MITYVKSIKYFIIFENSVREKNHGFLHLFSTQNSENGQK
jgi:hypothetical protein